jgi:transcription elongation factor Elf1
METGGYLSLHEIETAFQRFKICPKCNSTVGFWLGLKREHTYVQCKSCGARFDFCEVYVMDGNGKTPARLKFLRR